MRERENDCRGGTVAFVSRFHFVRLGLVARAGDFKNGLYFQSSSSHFIYVNKESDRSTNLFMPMPRTIYRLSVPLSNFLATFSFPVKLKR